MKRRDFFKRLGITAGAVVVAPTILAGGSEQISDEFDFGFLPDGDITGYGFDELTYPKISFDFETKRIYAGWVGIGNSRFTIQHVYNEVVTEFNEPHNLYNEIPMMAYHPTGFALLDGWEFGFNKRRICGGAWDYGDSQSLAYINVYGIGAVNKPSYVKFKYMVRSNNNSDSGWLYLGRGMIGNEKNPWTGKYTEFLFDNCIQIPKDAKIFVGAFNSRDELLDVYLAQHYILPSRVACPFVINFPVIKHTHNQALEKLRSYL